jgi:hypothetical protein
MKRATPLFVLAFFTCSHLMAQKALVDWSEVDKRSVWGPYLSHIAKGHGDEIITLQVKGSGLLGGKQTPTFTRYDRHWNPVLEKVPFNGSSKMGIYSLEEFNDNLFLLTKAWGSNAEAYTLQALPIDPVTLEAGTARDLVSFDSRHKKINASITTGTSNDKALVLLFATEPYDLNEDRKYYMGVWDNKFSKQWERITYLPYSAKFIILKGQRVSTRGDVYLACRQYEKEVINNPLQGTIDNMSPYKYKLFVYSKNDSLPREYTVDLKGKFVHDAILDFDNNGNLIIAGLYKNNLSGRVSGSFIAKLDKSTQQITISKMEALPTGNLLTRVAADGCGSADANDPGLDPAFKLVGGNQRDDGSIDLLAEHNTVSHHSSVSLATSSMVDQTTYKANDVVVVSFKPDGRIIYTHLPKKQEESPFWTHISIRYMNHGNDLVLFYNDNKKNVAGQLSQSLQAADSLGNSVFVMATINANGEVRRQVPFSNDDPEMMADLIHCHPMGADAMSLYVYKTRKFARSQFQLGLLTLQ